MSSIATIPDAAHHFADLGRNQLHYVTAGETGTPVLLVHGFPESWWAFHELIPLLARSHRVIAVDMPGFGDSSAGPATSLSVAASLGELIGHLGLGPVHLSGQDIGGVATFRLAASKPDLLRSYATIESALPGFGFEMFADVAKGGAWHVGFLAAPGIPELLLKGRVRAFLTDYAHPLMNATSGAISPADVDEFVRGYEREGGLVGTNSYYGSLLGEGEGIRELVERRKLSLPVLAVNGGSGPFTSGTMQQVAEHVTTATVDGVGHFVAMEAPERLAAAMLEFYRELDERA